jgi:hypothetical protein
MWARSRAWAASISKRFSGIGLQSMSPRSLLQTRSLRFLYKLFVILIHQSAHPTSATLSG